MKVPCVSVWDKEIYCMQKYCQNSYLFFCTICLIFRALCQAQLPKEQVAEPEKPLWTKSSEKFREKFKSTQTEHQPEKDQPQQENGGATNLVFFHSMYHMKTWLCVSLFSVIWLKHFM